MKNFNIAGYKFSNVDVDHYEEFFGVFVYTMENLFSAEQTQSLAARFERARLLHTDIPEINQELHNKVSIALYQAARFWNHMRDAVRTQENALAIQMFDKAFCEAREAFRKGFYTTSFCSMQEALYWLFKSSIK